MKNCLSTLKKNRSFRKVNTFLDMLSSRYFTSSYICLRSGEFVKCTFPQVASK